VLAENVAGLINMALDDVLSQLEGEGYSAGAVVLPACALNAPHRRDRVWIMAHADIIGLERGIEGVSETHGQGHDKKDMSTRELQEHRWGDGLSTPRVSGGNDGVSDRSHRIKALGNAIVPQVAYEILKLTTETTQQKEKK
jgi:DNA (cytosine-5)-methyltransferase 1